MTVTVSRWADTTTDSFNCLAINSFAPVLLTTKIIFETHLVCICAINESMSIEKQAAEYGSRSGPHLREEAMRRSEDANYEDAKKRRCEKAKHEDAKKLR